MAAKTVNIRHDLSDAHYRYKMPQLLVKVEGKGNGIKTVLPNISDVARALSRPPTYPTKFFGCELGAQTIFDEKADRYIVNGAHDASRLRELLITFIDKFVLCPSCKNPETDLILTKNEEVLRDCKACGERRSVDMRHKLITYIIKNPPKSKKVKGLKGVPGADAAQAADVQDGDVEGEGGSDDELTRKITEGAREMDVNGAPPASNPDEWATDTSKEAVQARMEGLTAGVNNNLVVGNGATGEDEEGGDGPGGKEDAFRKWIVENRDKTDAEIYKEAQSRGIEAKRHTPQALAVGLFTENIVEEIGVHSALIKKFVGEGQDKHEMSLLGGIEYVVGEAFPDLIPSTSKVLMKLYQEDLVSEDTIRHFAKVVTAKYVDKTTSKQVRRAAKPFIDWIDAAESDEESD